MPIVPHGADNQPHVPCFFYNSDGEVVDAHLLALDTAADQTAVHQDLLDSMNAPYLGEITTIGFNDVKTKTKKFQGTMGFKAVPPGGGEEVEYICNAPLAVTAGTEILGRDQRIYLAMTIVVDESTGRGALHRGLGTPDLPAAPANRPPWMRSPQEMPSPGEPYPVGSPVGPVVPGGQPGAPPVGPGIPPGQPGQPGGSPPVPKSPLGPGVVPGPGVAPGAPGGSHLGEPETPGGLGHGLPIPTPGVPVPPVPEGGGGAPMPGTGRRRTDTDPELLTIRSMSAGLAAPEHPGWEQRMARRAAWTLITNPAVSPEDTMSLQVSMGILSAGQRRDHLDQLGFVRQNISALQSAARNSWVGVSNRQVFTGRNKLDVELSIIRQLPGRPFVIIEPLNSRL